MSELSDLENYIIEKYADLKFEIATGCRCAGCPAWKIVDCHDKILIEADTLEDIVKAIRAQ